jgi:hypothetical protein
MLWKAFVAPLISPVIMLLNCLQRSWEDSTAFNAATGEEISAGISLRISRFGRQFSVPAQ